MEIMEHLYNKVHYVNNILLDKFKRNRKSSDKFDGQKNQLSEQPIVINNTIKYS